MKKEKAPVYYKDMFDKAAEEYLANARLPYDKIRAFTLANQFAHFTLEGRTNQENVDAAVGRIRQLQSDLGVKATASTQDTDRPAKQ